jgi:hypothetical protein
MSVLITVPETQFRWKHDGSIFIFHQLPFLELNRLIVGHQTNGEMADDTQAEFGYNVMTAMIDDWEEVQDENGNDIPFKKDYIEGIPARVVTLFLQEIVIPRIDKIKDETLDLMKDKETEGGTKEQVELGNSEPM